MTNERLKELLMMVLEDKSSNYLCNRVSNIFFYNHNIKIDEINSVREYMYVNRPFKNRYGAWWYDSDYTTHDEYMKAKHEWLQNLINKLQQ